MSKIYWRQKFYNNLLKKKIVKVQQVLSKNQYPPKFDEKKWNIGYRNYSRYEYVLDLPVRDRLRQLVYPGVFSGRCVNGEIYSSSVLVEYIKSDLDFLGFSYREDNGTLNEGEWRIAIYYTPTFHDVPIGFHFIRQNEDGSWSEKQSRRRKIHKVKECGDHPPELFVYNLYLCKTLVVKKCEK